MELPLASNHVRQGFTAEVLHHQEWEPLGRLTEILHMHQRGVNGLGRQLGFPHQARHGRLVSGNLRVNQLEGDLPIQVGVRGGPHRCEGPSANQPI
jgi:hypothetical protein